MVDSLEGSEPEKGIRNENKPGWAAPNWRNWLQRSSSSSSSSSSVSTPKSPDEQDYPYESKTEDSNFLKPLGDWERRGSAGTGSRSQTEYGTLQTSVCYGVIVLMKGSAKHKYGSAVR